MVTVEQARYLADLLDSFADGQTVDQAVFALRDLADQVEALQADAERWRFIQNTDNFAPFKWGMVRSYDGPFEEGWEILTDAEVDAAIAARKDQP